MLKKLFFKGKSLYQQALFPFTPVGVKKKFVFIHIPKAAGTAVRIALGEPQTGRQHLPWWIYQQASPKRFQEFYKFAFIRNPLDRAFSGYNYLKSGGNKMGDFSVAKHLKSYENFNDFVEGELLNGRMIYHPIFRPQSWYLCDWRGEVRVDYLGRFESIASDFENVVQDLQLENFKGLSVVNKSPYVSEEINSKTKRIISEVYRNDYQLWYYEA